MEDFEKLGVFYLGRASAPEPAAGHLLLYPSKDLVTHAVCVGMTGSGKTGLCIDLIEETAIDQIPAILIDPKGDLCNLLLQFPNLAPADFQPWVSDDEAQAQNISREQLATQQATSWKQGLENWGENGDRIRKLQESADFSIYTPGSTIGKPLSILKSFDAPAGSIIADAELLRDRVANTATAILSLAGIQADPLKSREHILLSAIFQNAWSKGQSLDLASLIQQVQTPPVQKAGVMDIETFFPAKDRFELAMTLNNLLAAPGFECWMQGEPLDVASLLHTPAGKPRISIIYIAHLSDAERMFIVSLLLNELSGWVRTQPGTSSLRALLYMDEIFGYFPPVANPPSKRPLLTLLKQARAFGVGVVLATQNPVDLDYKGLANCGTWFIGRLQTERDKNRLLDGLESASGESGTAFDRAGVDHLLSTLPKRSFLMNNIHEGTPVVFESRWALSYLRGPLTRNEIKLLTQGAPAPTAAAPPPLPSQQPAYTPTATAPPPLPPQPTAPVDAQTGSATQPLLPPAIPQAYIPVRGAASSIVYKPLLFGAVQIRFVDSGSAVDSIVDKVFLTEITDEGIPVRWENSTESSVDAGDLEKGPLPGARFTEIVSVGTNPKNYGQWSKDLVTWIYGNQALNIFHSDSLDSYSKPNESERDFRVRLQQAAREERDRAAEDIKQKYAPKIAQMQERLRRAQDAVNREKEQSQSQTIQAAIAVGSSLLGAFLGRSVISKTNLTHAASAARAVTRARKESQDIDRVNESVDAVQQQLDDLNAQFKAEVDALATKIDPMTEKFEVTTIKPKKTNISIRLFTLAWAPHVADATGQLKPAWE